MKAVLIDLKVAGNSPLRSNCSSMWPPSEATEHAQKTTSKSNTPFRSIIVSMGLPDGAVYDLLGRLSPESVYVSRLSKRQSEMTGNFCLPSGCGVTRGVGSWGVDRGASWWLWLDVGEFMCVYLCLRASLEIDAALIPYLAVIHISWSNDGLRHTSTVCGHGKPSCPMNMT